MPITAHRGRLLAALVVFTALAGAPSHAASLRFFGNGVAAPDADRVKIEIDDAGDNDPGPPADVGGTDFTLELWIKAAAADNTAAPVACGNNVNWIYGNIVVDRDRYNQDRKFGLSLAGGRLVFGVSGEGTGDHTICGTTNVLDAQWHHVAVERRRADGHLWLYVDGIPEADAAGPAGDVSYPDDGVPCPTCCGGGPCTNSDPYLVIGAEKHDAGSAFPAYRGLVDEIRLSNVLRYGGSSFTPPGAPFAADADTVGLYHSDEQISGACTGAVVDTSGASGGPSDGVCHQGGSPSGPVYDADSPFDPPAPAQCAAAPLPSCKNAAQSRLVLSDRSPDTSDQLIWRFGQGDATALLELGQPAVDTAYALCLYGNGVRVGELDIPPDSSRWRAVGTKGFKYKDADGVADGVRSALLKSGESGKTKTLLKAKGGSLPELDPPLPLALPVTVQLVKIGGGTCWQSFFDAPAVLKNQADQFKARN